MRPFVLAFICLCVAASVAALAPLHEGPQTEIVEGEFIVVLKDHLNATEAQLYIKHVNNRIASTSANYLMNTYSIRSFNGFSARLTPAMLSAIREDPQVAYVEPNMIVRASQSCSQQGRAPWGLDRADNREPNLDGNFRYKSNSGLGVDAYIVDTGIRTTHVDFEGRAFWGMNAVNDGKNTDCNGHGTHVAGTVAGKTYGFAKKASLYAVKVLGCTGSGTYEGVIAGINWVATQAASTRKPSVANMSLGGPAAAAVNDAVTKAVESGVTFVVAAGNDNDDACRYSPASASPAITVGATAIDDERGKEVDGRSYFSNVGSCVDILAPGSLIPSAWIDSDTSMHTISGTSMASPHVAGVAAVYLSQSPTATPSQVADYLTKTATPNKVDLECANSDQSCPKTPNLLLYSPCGSA